MEPASARRTGQLARASQLLDGVAPSRRVRNQRDRRRTPRRGNYRGLRRADAAKARSRGQLVVEGGARWRNREHLVFENRRQVSEEGGGAKVLLAARPQEGAHRRRRPGIRKRRD